MKYFLISFWLIVLDNNAGPLRAWQYFVFADAPYLSSGKCVIDLKWSRKTNWRLLINKEFKFHKFWWSKKNIELQK